MFVRHVTLEVPGCMGAVSESNSFDLAPGQTKVIGLIHSAGATGCMSTDAMPGLCKLFSNYLFETRQPRITEPL